MPLTGRRGKSSALVRANGHLGAPGSSESTSTREAESARSRGDTVRSNGLLLVGRWQRTHRAADLLRPHLDVLHAPDRPAPHQGDGRRKVRTFGQGPSPLPADAQHVRDLATDGAAYLFGRRVRVRHDARIEAGHVSAVYRRDPGWLYVIRTLDPAGGTGGTSSVDSAAQLWVVAEPARAACDIRPPDDAR